MKSFFQKSEKKYLRKKSALVQDYMLAGMGIVSIGLFCNYYNNKLNPPDPEEDTDSKEISIKYQKRQIYQDNYDYINSIKDGNHRFISNQAIKSDKGKQIQIFALILYFVVLQAAKGQKYIQEEQLKQIEQEQNERKVKVLMPEVKK